MKSYIMKRLTAMLLTLWLIVTLTFFLMHLIPGSPFNQERATNETIQRNLENFYHLNDPLPVQYVMYLKSLVTLDFGPSIVKSTQDVNDMLGSGFPVSFELGFVTLLLATVSGIGLGVLAALRHNGFFDYLAMTIAVIGISVPNFILATLLIQELSVNQGWFPTAQGPPPARSAPDPRPR